VIPVFAFALQVCVNFLTRRNEFDKLPSFFCLLNRNYKRINSVSQKFIAAEQKQ